MPYSSPEKQREYLTTYARTVFTVRHKARLRQYQRTWELKNPEKYLWHAAKSRAKKYSIDFTLRVEDIVIPKTCPVFGFPLVFYPERTAHRVAKYDAPSLDRIDNSKGYTKDNVEVISFRANSLKSDGSLQEFQALVAHMKCRMDK